MFEKDFTKLLLEDDIYCVANAIKKSTIKYTNSRWTNAKEESRRFDKYVVVGDDNPIARVTIDAFDKYLKFKHFIDVVGIDIDKGNIKQFNLSNEQKLDKHTAFLFSVDCDNTATFNNWFEKTEKILKTVSKFNSLCLVSVIVPDFPDLPMGIGSLAEREFDAHMRLIKTPSISQQNFLKIEGLCRKATKEFGTKIILLRIPNVFGFGCDKVKNWDFNAIFKDILDKSEVSISEVDFSFQQSLTYIVDAASIAFHMLYNGMPGNIYNFTSFNTSLADIKMSVYNKFKDKFGLRVLSPAVQYINKRCLSTIKIEQSDFNYTFDFETTINRFFCWASGYTYVDGANEKIYCGKLDIIKELEMDMLKEVDQICEKHNLKYFLAAGTLLGAKRYGHNIPWDDDLDIAFLRRDFEKFRKIVQHELSNKFEYCCYFNGTESHYLVDKIRVKDTWFSTKYSSINKIPDGVFLDILVYDATSDIRPIAWLHNKIAGVFQFFICQRLWTRPKRRDFSSLITYGICRLLTIFPLKWWHWVFECVVKAFSFKKTPKYFIDGLGARAGIKLIPSKGMFDTTRIPFDGGFMAASLEDPEGYLQFAYGKNYLEEPPLSEQHGHPLARIDLGESLFKKNAGNTVSVIPSIDLRGELFE